MAYHSIERGRYRITAFTEIFSGDHFVGQWSVVERDVSAIPVAKGNGESSSDEAKALANALGAGNAWALAH